MSNKKIWEHRLIKNGKTEPPTAFNYFQEYLTLGRDRTFKKLVENNGKRLKYMYNLSERWDWYERANAYDLWLIEENKREFEEETRERYKLANSVSLEVLRAFDKIIKGNPSFKELKGAGDLAAKLIKRESAVELDTSNGKFTNLTGEEIGDIFLASINKASGGYEKEEEEHVNGENRE